MGKEKLYSLQGIIFQKGLVLGLGEKSGIGIAVKIQQAINYGMFHAIVGPSEEDPKILCGHMSDRWGNSKITDFKISEEELSFTKWYENRPPIDYTFVFKKENVYHGVYEGDDCGTGLCKCIVNEINKSFFDPNEEIIND
jgi:hypothetical protein